MELASLGGCRIVESVGEGVNVREGGGPCHSLLPGQAGNSNKSQGGREREMA